MVEAPGYCPPGPKCLFHAILYRHSRKTGPPYLGSGKDGRKDSPPSLRLRNKKRIAYGTERLIGDLEHLSRLML